MNFKKILEVSLAVALTCTAVLPTSKVQAEEPEILTEEQDKQSKQSKVNVALNKPASSSSNIEGNNVASSSEE